MADSVAPEDRGAPHAAGAVPRPRVSLIICSRNRPALLADTVNSVLAGQTVPDELVVIDQSDAARPGLPAISAEKACELRYVWTQTIGLGLARNLGIAAATGPILVFIDDDMWVARDWLARLVSALCSAGERAVVTGQVAAAPAGLPNGFAPSLTTQRDSTLYVGRQARDVLAAGNMAMWRATVDEVGLFDPGLGAGSRFPSSEDNDYCYRLLAAGYAILYAADAIVYHRAWRTRKDYLPLKWRYGRGQGAFYAKHFTRRDGDTLQRMGRDIWFYLKRAPQQIWRRRLASLAGDFSYICGMLSGATEWLIRERRRT